MEVFGIGIGSDLRIEKRGGWDNLISIPRVEVSGKGGYVIEAGDMADAFGCSACAYDGISCFFCFLFASARGQGQMTNEDGMERKLVIK